MKQWLFLFFFVVSVNGLAQSHHVSFGTIDWKVQTINAPSPDSLSVLLTAPYTTQVEKVRAIYSWIVQHISYNTNIYKPLPAVFKNTPEPWDTAAVWKSGDEMTAQKVLFRRVAVCEGYSKLFKVLCAGAGIEVRVINGYGRCTNGSTKFRTNHTWNAVKIDSAWYLLDVTWAAGYIDFRDAFVFSQNDFYFLTPPDQFIKDHYPEDLTWTLLSQPPPPSEQKRTPFKSKNFIKYGINAFFPAYGQIEASQADTLSFIVELKDAARAKMIGSDPFLDTAAFNLAPRSDFIKPFREDGNKAYYRYVPHSGAEWVHLIYNNDVILRYRILLRPETLPKISGEDKGAFDFYNP